MKTTIATLIITLLLFAGCDRYLDSQSPTEPEPVELASPINVSVTLDDRAVTLDWDHANPSEVSQFILYSSDSLDGDYALRDSTTTYSYTFENLIINRTHFFAVAPVGANGIEGHRSSPVSAFVGPLSIVINEGRLFTGNRQVQVRLNSNSTTTHVMLTEDSTMAGAVYEAFSTTKQFELSAGEGLKTVYARFLFSDGAATGDLLSDNITLDQKAEISSVGFSPSGPFVAGDTVTFTLDATETGGEGSVLISGGPTVNLYDDGVAPDQTMDDGVYIGRLIFQPDVVLTDAQITGSFTDLAGNNASLVSGQVINVVNTPLAVQVIAAEAISSFEISLNWTRSSIGDFGSYRIFRAADTSVDNSGLPLATLTSRSTVSWTDTTALASTTYYYRVYVYNGSGLSAGSNVVNATTLANDPPDPVVLAGVLVDSVSIRLSWSESNALDFDSYRIFRDFVAMSDTSDGTLIDFGNSRSSTTFTDYAPLSDTTYYYRVYVFDRQGAYTGSNTVTVSK